MPAIAPDDDHAALTASISSDSNAARSKASRRACRGEAFLTSFEALQTGDILLYQTRDWGALFNRTVQHSQWSHAGVVVRYRGTNLHCDSCLRVTIGTREENDAFLAMLTKTASAIAGKRAKE